MSWHEKFEIADLSTSLVEVIPPRDLETRPHRVITFEVADGAEQRGLADVKVQTGPTAAEPWEDEDLSATGIPTLAAGAHKPYRFSRYDRWVRVLAQSATDADKQCNLIVYLDAVG
ncbi:MAG: hypothetical protein ACE149_15645 [Armatimonadota bacterium]